MPPQLSSDIDQVLASVAQLASKLTGREGNGIREHIQQLAQVLAREGSDDELRASAARELEQLITALARLGAVRGPVAKAIRGFDLTKLADGLRTFVAYLRAPTAENQAQAEQLLARLQGEPALQPVPLEELQIDGRVESLAVQSALRQGLSGAEMARAVDRMKREMAAFKRQLEVRTDIEGRRTSTAIEMKRLLEALVQTGSALGKALDGERAAILAAFCRVDLAHMAAGMRAYAQWIPASMGRDPAASVAALQAQLAEALGPATEADAMRSDAERQADAEREAQAAIDRIFRGAP
jgi:hypothetical protein